MQALRDGRARRVSDRDGLRAGRERPEPGGRAEDFRRRRGGPVTHPVIVHLDSPQYLPRWAAEVPTAAARLAESSGPGR